MLGRDDRLHRDGAQIDEFEIVARFQRRNRLRIEAGAKARRFIHQSEKYGVARGAERSRLGRRKQRIECFAALLEHRELAGDHIIAGAVVRRHRRQRRVVTAIEGGALDAASRIGLARLQTEIVAGGGQVLPQKSAAARDGNGWRDMDGTAAMRNLIRDAPIRNCCASIEAAAVGAVKVSWRHASARP